MAKVLVFIVIVVFLQFKPAGLFPPKGRMVEA
jgi:urea transport system permease protein